MIDIFFTQFTAWPEMLTYPYLLNNGFVLYRDLIVQYTPLMIWFLQIVERLFGYSTQTLIILTWALFLINISLIFILSKKIWHGVKGAILSVFIFSLWFVYFEGNGFWFELFQTPFILLAFYFLYCHFFNKSKNDLILGGFFLSLSFFIKQSAFWIILIIFGWIIFNNFKKNNLQKITNDLITILAPFILLFISTVVVAFYGGYLKEYINWAYVFTFLQFPFSKGFQVYPNITQLIKLLVPLVFLLPILLAILKRERKATFAGLFLLAAFMAAFPRWGLFHLMPFLAVGALVAPPYIRVGKKLIAAILIIWVIVIIRQDARVWLKPTRFFEPEILKLAEKIKENGYEDFFIFNGPDQLYVLTKTVPKVRPYVQNFAWFMESDGMQQQVASSLNNTNPQFIVFSPFSGHGGFNIGDYRPNILANFIEKNYTLKIKLSDNIWILKKR